MELCVDNEGTILGTKVLVFVLVVESSVEECMLGGYSDPVDWRKKFGNERAWGIGGTIYL